MPSDNHPDEALLRAAFELAPIGVLIGSVDGRIIWTNRTFCTMIGVGAERLTGLLATTLCHPEDLLVEQVHDRQLLAGALDSYQIRKRFLRPDGEVVHTLQTVHLVETEGVRRVVAHVLDTTEQVEREADLHTHERMRTVGRLAGSIAHDFNNLLTAIQANGSMIAESVDDPEVVEMVADVLAAAEAGARLTDRLLGFSRGGVTRSDRVDLAALVRERHPALRASVPGTRVQLEVDGPAWIFGDIQQIEQVLLNLIGNARQAEQITVRVGHRWADVFLDVEDDGPGMPEAVRARAFEPYFTTRGDQGGTGLGLTTVYAVVTGHQGTVTIDSTLGRGTSVRIRIPAVDAPSGEVHDLGDSVNLDPRGRHLALVVDDDGPVRRAVSRALRAAGCEVIEADGVGTAQARFARHAHRVSVVIADVILLDGSGPDLVERLRVQRPELPAIYMSGYSREELESHGSDSLEPLLAKPFTPQQLVAAVIPLLT